MRISLKKALSTVGFLAISGVLLFGLQGCLSESSPTMASISNVLGAMPVSASARTTTGSSSSSFTKTCNRSAGSMSCSGHGSSSGSSVSFGVRS